MQEADLKTRVLLLRKVYEGIGQLMQGLVPGSTVTVIVSLCDPDGEGSSSLWSNERTDAVLPSLRRFVRICEEQGDDRSRILRPDQPEAS